MPTQVLRSRFFWKLYAGYVALIIVGATVIGLLVSRQVESNHLEETSHWLRSTTILLSEVSRAPLEADRISDLTDLVADLSPKLGVRITIVSPGGTVLADSHADPATMDDHSSRGELVEAARSGSGFSMRFSKTRMERLIYAARVVGPIEQPAGFARAAISVPRFSAELMEIRRLVAIGAAIGSLIALVLGFVVGRRVVTPLVSLTRSAAAAAAGDLHQRVSTEGNDEIGDLARSFNVMARTLEARVSDLGNQRSTLEAILGGMVEGVIAIDRSDNIIHLNEAAEKILQLEPGKSTGRPFWEAARVPALAEAANEARQQGNLVSREIRLVRPEGDRRIELHAQPLEETGVISTVMVLHDITEKKRLEEIRRTFVANVSHELKTPVTAIRAVTETLSDDPEMPPETRESFHRGLRTQALRLSALVSDILALARLERLPDGHERQELDLLSLVRTELELFHGTAESRNLDLDMRCADHSVPVLGDAPSLSRLVSNLLDNAIKYSPEDGVVSVRLTQDSGFACLEVEDQGIGIEPQHHDRIFERFYRVDPARSRELGGTGLGLAIVKHIALNHGGSIELESEPGRGSLFRVRLPARPTASTEAPAFDPRPDDPAAQG